MVERVVATPEALALIDELKAQHGELMFHQSGGCCDNSAANWVSWLCKLVCCSATLLTKGSNGSGWVC